LGRSLDLELFQSIYPDFRFAFVYLDSARDLDVFSFDTGKYRRFVYGDSGGIQPVKVWFG